MRLDVQQGFLFSGNFEKFRGRGKRTPAKKARAMAQSLKCTWDIRLPGSQARNKNLWTSIVFLIAFVLIILSVLANVEMDKMGERFELNRVYLKGLTRENTTLRAELSRLLERGRLEAKAREYGFVHPKPGQIIWIRSHETP